MRRSETPWILISSALFSNGEQLRTKVFQHLVVFKRTPHDRVCGGQIYMCHIKFDISVDSGQFDKLPSVCCSRRLSQWCDTLLLWQDGQLMLICTFRWWISADADQSQYERQSLQDVRQLSTLLQQHVQICGGTHVRDLSIMQGNCYRTVWIHTGLDCLFRNLCVCVNVC